jgi:hypothetical protein
MATRINNNKKRVELYLMVLASCIGLAGVWAVLAMPEIALAKGKPVTEYATYTVTFSGELVGSGTATVRVLDNRIEHMALQQPLDLHTFFVEKIDQSEADICFPDPPTTGDGIHGIQSIKQKPENGASITIFFEGFDHNSDPLMYRLDLTGYFADLSNWPPAPGTSSNVILEYWEVKSDTKGGRNKACQAEGLLNVTVTVYRTP